MSVKLTKFEPATPAVLQFSTSRKVDGKDRAIFVMAISHDAQQGAWRIVDAVYMEGATAQNYEGGNWDFGGEISEAMAQVDQDDDAEDEEES